MPRLEGSPLKAIEHGKHMLTCKFVMDITVHQSWSNNFRTLCHWPDRSAGLYIHIFYLFLSNLSVALTLETSLPRRKMLLLAADMLFFIDIESLSSTASPSDGKLLTLDLKLSLVASVVDKLSLFFLSSVSEHDLKLSLHKLFFIKLLTLMLLFSAVGRSVFTLASSFEKL